MAKTGAERAREYRARHTQPRELKPCGTYAAAKRHQRNGEPLDDACRVALADEQRRLYLARKARQA